MNTRREGPKKTSTRTKHPPPNILLATHKSPRVIQQPCRHYHESTRRWGETIYKSIPVAEPLSWSPKSAFLRP